MCCQAAVCYECKSEQKELLAWLQGSWEMVLAATLSTAAGRLMTACMHCMNRLVQCSGVACAQQCQPRVATALPQLQSQSCLYLTSDCNGNSKSLPFTSQGHMR